MHIFVIATAVFIFLVGQKQIPPNIKRSAVSMLMLAAGIVCSGLTLLSIYGLGLAVEHDRLFAGVFSLVLWLLASVGSFYVMCKCSKAVDEEMARKASLKQGPYMLILAPFVFLAVVIVIIVCIR